MSLLKVENLSKRFGGILAVQRLSFSLSEGETLGLIGPNGAGKTTLFNLISGYLKPDQGNIFLDGYSITGVPVHQICKRGLTRTFQLTQPFENLTTLENVMVGCFNNESSPSKVKETAREILSRVELISFAEVPAGTLTLVQRKRLELARSLATQPRVLFLDEIMAGLRPSEVKDITALLAEVRTSGVTLILIEHNFRVITLLCSRVLVMHHGELLAEGSPDTIASNPTVMHAYWGEKANA